MGKFEVKATSDNKVRFNLKATNGQVIATSQTYTTMRTLKTGILSIQKNAGAEIEDQTKEPVEVKKCPKYEIYLDKAGEFRFRLRASNGQTILASQGYTAKDSCINGIESVGKNAPNAEIVKVEE